MTGHRSACTSSTGRVVSATIDRVGADFVEAAVHPVGEPRRRGEVREVVALALPAVAAIRRLP